MAPIELVQVAKRTGELFGGKPGVNRIYNKDKSKWIDVLASIDTPVQGLTSWGTVGCSQTSIMKGPDGKSLGVELVMVVKNQVWSIGTILAACTFEVMDGAPIYPNLIVPNVVTNYVPTSKCKHLLMTFVDPLIWHQSMENLENEEQIITWLNALPITELEYRFAQENGVEALTDRMREKGFDMADLDRVDAL